MCLGEDMNRLKRLWDRKKIERNSSEYKFRDIKARLHQEFDGVKIYPMDKNYRVPSKESFTDILEQDVVDEINYQAEYFDCEDFSFLFKALSALHYRINSVGLVISYNSQHAFNVVMVEEREQLEVYKLEPQSDTLWKPEEPEKDKYVVNGEIILI